MIDLEKLPELDVSKYPLLTDYSKARHGHRNCDNCRKRMAKGYRGLDGLHGCTLSCLVKAQERDLKLKRWREEQGRPNVFRD